MELTVFDEQCGTCSSKHALLKRLADENGTSIKVAKYSGTNRIDLIENNEYGYCSLIKATKSVLDKIELENRTATQITSKERLDQRLWDAVALREAINLSSTIL